MWNNSNIGLQEKGLRISLIAVDWAREVIANTQWAELSYNATVADGFILFVEPYPFENITWPEIIWQPNNEYVQ